MASVNLPVHNGLYEGTRLRWLVSSQERSQSVEIALLMGCGFLAAAASQWLDFGLRIPGHAILRVVIPMGLGLALVPRRGAGTIMGISAMVSGLLLGSARFAGGGLSFGALTSLALTGPFLDLSLWRAWSGWRLYAGFALAGLASNATALIVRGGAKLIGLDGLRGRPLMEWLPHASVSYLICGIVAGVISGFIWFQGRRRLAREE